MNPNKETSTQDAYAARMRTLRTIRKAILKERARCAKIVEDAFIPDPESSMTPASPTAMLQKILHPRGSKPKKAKP